MTNWLRQFLTGWWLVSCLVPLFIGAYFFNIDGWLMHDDEGTDFYEVWQMVEGKQPGVDYLAEQQPLYLLSGRLIMAHSNEPARALRIFTAAQVLFGSLTLALATKNLWGKQIALLTLGLVLGSGMLYEQARLFRPDPMMFAWELMSLGAMLTAVHQQKWWWWAVAGVCAGTAVLWKLFGIFPVVGFAFFFLNWLVKERENWQEILVAGLHFAVPFLLVAGGLSFLLYGQLGFYYSEAFSYHLEANQNNGLLQQLIIVSGGYLLFLVSNAIFIFWLPLRFLNRKQPHPNEKVTAVLVTQLFTPIIFLLITRPIHLRYYLFLLPTFAILLALEVQVMLKKINNTESSVPFVQSLVLLLSIAAGWLITQPRIIPLMLRKETDTKALATLVAAHTEPDDVVISDYAGINFFAKRPSIYEASIIAGAQIDSGSVSGALLIERIEEVDAKMVLIHIAGGEPTPHQLVHLIDYPQFRRYVESNFDLLTVFDRAGQQIEVFTRR